MREPPGKIVFAFVRKIFGTAGSVDSMLSSHFASKTVSLHFLRNASIDFTDERDSIEMVNPPS